MSFFQMAPIAEKIARELLAVRPRENVCLLTDNLSSPRITQVLSIIINSLGAELVILNMPAWEGKGEPPLMVTQAMVQAEIIINQTSSALTHTNAQREAIKKGTRVYNLRGINEEMMVRGGITADYQGVREITKKVADLLTRTKEVHLLTKEGTDLRIGIEGRKAHILAGFATRPGEFSGLPDGEATLAPLEGSSEGKIVNPYAVEKIGLIKEDFCLTITQGRISSVEGGSEAIQLKELLQTADGSAWMLPSQFALGTNPKARIIPNIKEVSKRWGTAHVALGDNLSLGGKIASNIHMDMVFLEPTVYLDRKKVLEGGKILV